MNNRLKNPDTALIAAVLNGIVASGFFWLSFRDSGEFPYEFLSGLMLTAALINAFVFWSRVKKRRHQRHASTHDV